MKFLPQCQKSDFPSAKLILTTDISYAKEMYDINENWFLNKNAAEQGYIICGNAEREIVICAKTQTGLAYGITTFIQLPALEGDFEIRDYPEFRYRANKWVLWAETEIWSYDFGDGIDAYRDRIMRKLDLCLKYKINMVYFDAWGPDTERAPHYKRLMREFNLAARERGISLIFGAYTMGYGLSAHPFGKNFGKVHKTRRSYPDGEIYKCLGTMTRDGDGDPYVISREFGGCLSNEVLMEEKLEELEKFVREIEPGALYLHNMDSLFIHETLWLARCDNCRRRWPNDDIYAKDGMSGAFAEFFDCLNGRLQTVKTENYDAESDLIIFNVSPGYLENFVSDEEVCVAAKFWANVRKYAKVRNNVYPIFRELYYNRESDNLRISDTIANYGFDFGIIAFCGGDGFFSDDLFPTTSLLHKMMRGADVMISCSGNAFAEPLQIFNAEYMWNSSDSGFYNLSDVPVGYAEFIPYFEKMRDGKLHADEIFREGGMLDIICGKLYGTDAQVMSEFFKLRGENGECPAPYPCNKELLTNGSAGIFEFRWDNEWDEGKREAYAKKLVQIKKVSQQGHKILSEATCSDAVEYRRLLGINIEVIDILCDYMSIYCELDKYFKTKNVSVTNLSENVASLKLRVLNAKKKHKEYRFQFVDVLQGALARRTEIFESIEYDLTLMEKSIKSGERIPSDREERSAGAWW